MANNCLKFEQLMNLSNIKRYLFYFQRIELIIRYYWSSFYIMDEIPHECDYVLALYNA